ncbi:MAG: YIP1 family protein [Vicinamibacteria bacterium]
MASFAERMIGAAKLEVPIYEEVEHDQNALGQAMGVVILAAIAAGIGSLRGGPSGFLIGIITALVGWFIWAGIIFIVGTKVMPEPQTKADLGQLLRTMGFAASPGLLGVLAIIPFFGWIVRLVVVIWQLIAMVVAVRQALDYQTTGKAVVVCLLGWLAYMVVAFVVASAMGLTAAIF